MSNSENLSSSDTNNDSNTDVESEDSPGEEMMLRLLKYIEDDIANNNRIARRRFIERNREEGHSRLYHDYFSQSPVYPDHMFRRRFRMRRDLFLRVVTSLENHSPYFQQIPDAAKRQSLTGLQKCTAAIRQLAYGVPADNLDEYLRMGNSTAVKCLFEFCKNVVEVFGDQYLRRPDGNDVQRLLQLHESKHGFPGMLGSLDCMHWKWKNCPVAWKDQFTRGHGSPTIVLEAVASQDLWIWHAFFGVAGSRNDINVLNESPLFNNVLLGQAPVIHYTVNGAQYNHGYYLTDGIYPEWSTFVKAFSCPQDPKRKLFKERQESARKDVERAFGVLQARWAIVRGPARFWYRKKLKLIMLTCIILHKMIVENEGEMVMHWNTDEVDTPTQVMQGATPDFQAYLQRNTELHSNPVHHQLRADLVEHIWAQSNNVMCSFNFFHI